MSDLGASLQQTSRQIRAVAERRAEQARRREAVVHARLAGSPVERQRRDQSGWPSTEGPAPSAP